LQEHRLLLQALQSRDAAASAQRMREHFLSGLEAAN
jgi:DNA-binding GntR family transcriptional regulator